MASTSEHIRMKYTRIPLYILAVLIVTSLVYYFLMTLFTSPHIDDLHYSYPYRHWLLGEGEFPGFEPWWRTIKAHFFGINGRLGDKLLLGFLLLPKWVAASIASFCTVGFMILASYIATGNIRKHTWLSTAIIIALILSLPWYDSMFLGCMTVNYIMASFWGTAALALYFRKTTLTSEDRRRKLKYAGAVLLGFLAGSWHECFTFIIAPGLLIFPFFEKRLTKLQICVLSGGILGGIFIISNPGFWMRYDNQMHLMTMKKAILILDYANASLSFLVLFPVFMAIKKLRHRYTRKEAGIMTACFIAFILNIIIFLSNLNLPRVPWFGMILGYIGLGLILSPFRPAKPISVPCRIIVTGATLFCLVHFFVTVITQYKVDREYREIISLYRSSGDGTVFYTETASKNIPWIALARPSSDQFHGWRIDSGTDTFYKQAQIYLQLVPEELKDFSISDAEPVNETEGIYLYKGNFVTDAEKTLFIRWRKVKFTTPEGDTYVLTLLCHRFTTSDGRTWYYFLPDKDGIKDIISQCTVSLDLSK